MKQNPRAKANRKKAKTVLRLLILNSLRQLSSIASLVPMHSVGIVMRSTSS